MNIQAARSGKGEQITYQLNFKDMKKQIKTYDVVFNDDNNTNSKGMRSTKKECRQYINNYNGTNESYFEDYKGGTVSIVCNETNETIYCTTVK